MSTQQQSIIQQQPIREIPQEFEQRLIDANLDLCFRGKKAIMWQRKAEELIELIQQSANSVINTFDGLTDEQISLIAFFGLEDNLKNKELVSKFRSELQNEANQICLDLILSQKFPNEYKKPDNGLLIKYQAEFKNFAEIAKRFDVKNISEPKEKLKLFVQEICGENWFENNKAVLDFIETLTFAEMQYFTLAVLRVNEFRMELL